MRFEFRDEMRGQYMRDGYLILRGIVPPALLRDLRPEADKARALAHQLNGPQAQRLQPVEKYADRINQKPFQDYCDLPELNDAIRKLFGDGYKPGQRSIMGILVEPQDRAWNLGWHRDGVVEVPIDAQDGQLIDTLKTVIHDLRVYNQVNCAIYPDSCTWVVPGSHLRLHDLPGERQSAREGGLQTEMAHLNPIEAEMACLEHCLTFPGAVQVHLQAGDYMVYRNIFWHTGNYVPYAPRATMHDIVSCTHAGDWGHRWWQAKKDAIERMEQRKKAAATV